MTTEAIFFTLSPFTDKIHSALRSCSFPSSLESSFEQFPTYLLPTSPHLISSVLRVSSFSYKTHSYSFATHMTLNCTRGRHYREYWLFGLFLSNISLFAISTIIDGLKVGKRWHIHSRGTFALPSINRFVMRQDWSSKQTT